MTLSLISTLLLPSCMRYVVSAAMPDVTAGSLLAHIASSFSTSSRSRGTVLATETLNIG